VRAADVIYLTVNTVFDSVTAPFGGFQEDT